VVTERKPPGVSFETWVDTQIRRGLERGDFDDLPGAGRPLPRPDREETAYDWAVAKARREGVDTAAMLPPGLALRKEREDLPVRAVALPSEAAVRALAEDFNERVAQFWRRPQEGPPVAVGQVEPDALVAAWRVTRPPPPLPVPAPPPPARRPWWRRK
jgi:DnaJ-like protein